jgi:hypothetical protein
MLPNRPPVTTGDFLDPLPKFLIDAVTGVLPLVSLSEPTTFDVPPPSFGGVGPSFIF